MRKIKIKLNAYDYVIIGLLICLAIYTGFQITSHLLLVNSIKALIDSTVYYFRSIISPGTIGNEGVSFLVIDESIIKSVLPIDFKVFGYRFLVFFELLVNPDNIGSAWAAFLIFLKDSLIILMIILPPMLLAFGIYRYFVLKNYHKKVQEESKPLQTIKKCRKPFDKFIVLLKNLFFHWKDSKVYVVITMILVAYNLNIASMLILLLAWYLYFIFSFNFLSIYHLVVRLLLCLSPLFRSYFIPLWVIGIIALSIYLKFRVGYRNLQKLLERDIETVDAAGVSLMLVGGPGAGKGSCGVIIQIIMEYLLRSKADALMMEIRLEFPEFPWREVEMIIEKKMAGPKTKQFKNKVQVECHFSNKFKEERVWEDEKTIFGYSLKNKKKFYWDALKQETILEAILDYAQLYYVYSYRLTVGNFSLRIDKQVELNECHARMTFDPFHTDPRNEESFFRTQRINFNQLRVLKQVNSADDNIENTALWDAGIIYTTEYEKERGNAVTNRNRKGYDTKPSNDGIPTFIAFFRHLTTIRHTCFGRMLMDGQDLNQLSGRETKMVESVAFIKSGKRKTKYAIPLFWLEAILLEWADDFFVSKVDRYINTRNDQTVYSYFVTSMAAFFRKINRKIWGTFGYESVPMSISGSNLEGSQVAKGDSSFNLLYKLAYSDHFVTDSYSGFWKEAKKAALSGINQLDEFKGKVATREELKSTNGYLSNELASAADERMTDIANLGLKLEEKSKERKQKDGKK